MKDTTSVAGSAVSDGVRILQMLYELGFPQVLSAGSSHVTGELIEGEYRFYFPDNREGSFVRQVRIWIKNRRW